MSNAEPEERVTASSDGVAVEKSFEPDDFPVPAIAFVIRSERDETVAVRMVDSVPEHVTPEDIGFHPKYGAEFWGVDGDAIVFEREFEPGEEYTTVYGLRGGDSDDVEKYMTDPVLETVHPPLEEAESEDVVRDVIEEEEGTDSTPETDAEAQDDIESAIEEADTTEEEHASDVDTDEPAEAAETSEAAGTDHDGSAAAAAAATEGSLAAALADEIREGEVDDDDLEDLRDALGVEAAAGEAATGGAVDARIEHLQSEISDLQAYTDALESFLDENGDAQTLIEEFRTELDEAMDRIEDIDEQLDAKLDAIEIKTDERLEEFGTNAEAVLEETESRVDEQIDRIDETVEERIADHVEDLRSDLEALEEKVDEDVDDERLEAIESDISDIEDELSDVAEMRERLTAAFGAPSDDE